MACWASTVRIGGRLSEVHAGGVCVRTMNSEWLFFYASRLVFFGPYLGWPSVTSMLFEPWKT